MKIRYSLYFTLFIGCFIFYLGCQRTLISEMRSEHAMRAENFIPCGNVFDTTLINFNGELSGSIEVLNDETGFHVIIREVYADYKITRVQLLYGTKQHVIDNIVGLTDCATMQPRNPDTVITYTPDEDSVVVIDLPFDSLTCFYVNANVTLAKRDGAGNLLHSFNIWSNGTANASQNSCQQYFQFCKQQCTITPPPPGGDSTCGQLRTQTQHGWGSKKSNSISRQYLHANFAAAFPNGLKVGCNNGFTITMTSPQAISTLLPAEGKTEALKKNYINPVILKNSLVGEIIALTLNVEFDKFDPSFGEAGRTLESMYIKKGKFRGKTVGEFLAIANKALGKCGNGYKLSDIRNMAKHINDNYKNGDEDKHRLVCNPRDCSHDDHDEDDDDDDDDHHHDHGHGHGHDDD
jgi:hypothetical protein